MLNFLRRGVKSWVAKALLFLLIASFAVWGIGDIFSFRLDSAVATVGEREVTAEEFADALRRQQVRMARETGEAVTYAQMRQVGLDRRVLQGLVRDAALAAELDRLGIAAPDRAVAEAVRTNPAFQGPGGEFSDTAYRMLLSQQGFTPRRFEELTRTLVTQEVLTGAVAGTGTAPPGAPARIAAWQGERRGVELLRLMPAMAPDPGEPDDAALDAFLAENEARFTEPERRFGQYLVIDIDALVARSTPPEEDVRALYEAEIDRYGIRPRATIEQINFPTIEEAKVAAARIADGEIGFAELADERGLAPGDIAIGSVEPEDLPPAVADAVFALDGPGVAEPVETALGAALVRVEEISPGGTLAFEEVRDEIAEQLAYADAYALAPDVANEVQELRAGGRTIGEIAEAVEGVRAGEIAGWAADGTLAGGEPATGILGRPEVRAELADALDQEERDLIELSDGSFFLAHIERIEPPSLPERDAIRDRLVEAWQAERRTLALDERAQRIVQGLASGTGATLGSTAAGMGRQTVELAPFGRDNPPSELPEGMAREIFRAAEGDAVVARDPRDGSVVIASVTAVRGMAPEMLAESAESIEQVFADSLRRDVAEYFSRAVERNLEVRSDPAAIEEVFRLLGGGQGGAS